MSLTHFLKSVLIAEQTSGKKFTQEEVLSACTRFLERQELDDLHDLDAAFENHINALRLVYGPNSSGKSLSETAI